MPTISGLTAVAANTTSANVLAGSPFEFVAQPSIVRLAMTQAGAAATDITAVFQIGGEALMQNGNVSDRAAFPTFLDDQVLEAGASPGERLFLTFSNTTGGALDVQHLVDIVPI